MSNEEQKLPLSRVPSQPIEGDTGDGTVPVAALDYTPTAFEIMVIKHKSKLILVGVLAAVGSMFYYGARLLADHKHSAAAEALGKAQSAADLEAVGKSHQGQAAGGSALILAADKFAESKNYSESARVLQEFLSTYTDHPLRDAATLRLAESFLAQGNHVQAQVHFLEAAALTNADGSSPYAPFALYQLAEMLAYDARVSSDPAVAKAKGDEAVALYRQVANIPENPLQQQAKARLEVVKRKPAALIPFVAPDPTENSVLPDVSNPNSLSLEGDLPITLDAGLPSEPDMKLPELPETPTPTPEVPPAPPVNGNQP